MLRLALSLYFLCCLLRSFGDDRFENVALGKVCDQSSSWDNSHPAFYAVNGNTNGVFYKQPNCIQTATSDSSPWWQVNLGRRYPVYSITVWARVEGESITIMSNRIITVGGEECYRFGKVSLNSPREMKVNCTTPYVLNGTVVRVTRDPGPSGDDNAIQLCEVQVYSCSVRYWGSGCARDCGKCRGGAACDKVTGECGCEPGWMPPLCTQLCPAGTFGENCTQTCSENCRTCNNTNGLCTCKPGWTPPTCVDVCTPGTFGENCTQNCGQNCVDTKACNNINGQCTCKPGWTPPTCHDECTVGTFGQDCLQNCSSNCVDVCNKATGHCTCKSGWNPPNCTEECPDYTFGKNCSMNCSRNCDGVCDKVTGDCKCTTGWKAPNCLEECDQGTYGANCTERCGSCSDGPQSCHHVNGSCHSCMDNFMMPLCKPAGFGTKDAGSEANVAIIAGFVAFSIVVIVLVIVIVFLVRKIKSAGHEPDRTRAVATDHVNVVYQNTDTATDRVKALGPMKDASVTTTEAEAPQLKTSGSVDVYERVNPDLTNYDRLEMYENKKDITDVYTDLKPSHPG